ncbi:UNVERIFIED_CONTAM: hypothetical protein K2H54_002147, partial [Gekko kuhli]
KAFQDLRENRQFVTTAEDKEGVSEQSIQEAAEEEAQHDEPLTMDIQHITRRKLEKYTKQRIKTRKGRQRFREKKRNFVNDIVKKMRKRRTSQRKIKRTGCTKIKISKKKISESLAQREKKLERKKLQRF